MKRRKTPECTKSYCTEPAVAMGLCEKHLAEKNENEIRRDEAIRTLHSGLLEGEVFQRGELREEFLKLQEWWFRACDAINYRREDPALKDEAEYAATWCESLAELIIQDERAHRKGDHHPPPWNFMREHLWGRFKNLEAGLMSNGVPRH
jgi:hypothetical protein